MRPRNFSERFVNMDAFDTATVGVSSATCNDPAKDCPQTLYAAGVFTRPPISGASRVKSFAFQV
jgi:hypothetical protein